MTPVGRGGPGRGQGRKGLDPSGLESTTIHLRLRQDQVKKLADLGGSDWIRKMIDYAHAALKKAP